MLQICNVLELNPGRYYKWRRMLKEYGYPFLINKKSRAQGCPHKLLEFERQRIIGYALKHSDIRHRKLCYAMQDDGVAYVSPSTVYRVLRDEGLIAQYELPKKRNADGSVGARKPNDIWHMDITYIPVEKKHAYLITVLDGYSRYPVHHELSQTMTADDMQGVMSRALAKAGLFQAPPEQRPALISDNGTQLVAKSFQKFLNTWDIEHRRIAVRHPESNGKIEVFHRTIKYERVYVKEQYKTYYEAKDDLDQFIRYYAEERLHQGIGFVTPLSKYNGKAEKIVSKRKHNHQKAIEKRKQENRMRKQSQVA